MNIAHQYKLLPTTAQIATMNKWLDMCRGGLFRGKYFVPKKPSEYNYLLSERFDWWERNRNDINSCLLVCHLPELKDNPDYYSQKRGLVPLKQDRPWYKSVHSQVLQDYVNRVKLAYERFIKGEANGYRSGKPRFKAKNRYRSFTYTQINSDDINGNVIHLSKIGDCKLILHRPIPNGFKVKTAIVSKKSDGWYITLSLEDKSVPEAIKDIIPTADNSVALDLGLEKFAALNTGEFIDIPQYFRAAEEKLAKLQKKVSTRIKDSRARKLLSRKTGRLHQKIARQRKQFHFESAGIVLKKADVVFVENLKVKNMSRRCKPKQDKAGKFLTNGQSAKSGLNKSIADAGWASFIDILSFKAEKAGQKIVKVDPYGTSQYCSSCLNKVPKSLSERWHSCPNFSLEIDRDINSAILIKKLGLDVSLSIKRSRRNPIEACAVV